MSRRSNIHAAARKRHHVARGAIHIPPPEHGASTSGKAERAQKAEKAQKAA